MSSKKGNYSGKYENIIVSFFDGRISGSTWSIFGGGDSPSFVRRLQRQLLPWFWETLDFHLNQGVILPPPTTIQGLIHVDSKLEYLLLPLRLGVLLLRYRNLCLWRPGPWWSEHRLVPRRQRMEPERMIARMMIRSDVMRHCFGFEDRRCLPKKRGKMRRKVESERSRVKQGMCFFFAVRSFAFFVGTFKEWKKRKAIDWPSPFSQSGVKASGREEGKRDLPRWWHRDNRHIRSDLMGDPRWK